MEKYKSCGSRTLIMITGSGTLSRFITMALGGAVPTTTQIVSSSTAVKLTLSEHLFHDTF